MGKSDKSCFISSSMKIRTIIGTLMILGFMGIVQMGPNSLICFSFLVTTVILAELMRLAKDETLGWSINLPVVIIYTLLIFISTIYPKAYMIFPKLRTILPISIFKVAAFYGYVAMFMTTVCYLEKGILRSQIRLFFIIHMIPFVMGLTFIRAMENIIHGIYYFIVPSSLVIVNDILAYFFGKAFGKTKLYALSPNKTMEGFIGGAIGSLVVSLFFSYFKANCNFLPDKFDSIVKKTYLFPYGVSKIPFIYFVNIIFAIGASFIAPFMGFFASALKRTVGKKDFGSIFPGHGGMTDRMDCQVMMVWFTQYFLRTIRISSSSPTKHISEYILNNFEDSEITSIINFLKKER